MAKIPKPWFRKGRGWFVTVGGKQHNLGRDKQSAYQEYHRLMQMSVEKRKVSGQSLAAITDDFLEFVQSNRAQATYRWYRDLLQKFVALHQQLRVSDIKPFHVQRWVDAIPHLSKTSRRNHMRAVKRCVKWAMTQGYIDSNPLQYLPVPVGDRKEVLVSEKEYEQVLQFAKPDSLRDLIITTWETGCRPQESLRVQARHVDFTHHRWVIPASEAKGEKMTRIVYLTDKALEITRRLTELYPVGNLFRNARQEPWNAASVNCAIDRIRVRMGKAEMKRRGLKITSDEIAAIVPNLKPTRTSKGVEQQKTDAELRREAKVKLTNKLASTLAPRYSLYSLRHAFATYAMERGVDSVTVGVLLGHSDPSMLAKVYQHLSQNPKFLLEQTKKATTRA